ncbi:TolC family protein [uncultured Shewanella sp.]|uniref:TolC family protein n=1 Tax=uncultured Shewanella sp. TaxID=173975 RepID=UPI0026031BE2|nr:TolC family protein [uncultured Shewanella sp.]
MTLTWGCMSLDPSYELGMAAQETRRINGTLDPNEAWQLDVQAASPAWNGHSDLSYDAAVSVALQGDPSLRMALAKIVEQRAWYVQQGLPSNPSIGFGIGAAIDGIVGAPMFVQGMQMLSWLWKNPHKVAMAEADLKAAVYMAGQQSVIILARTRIELAAVLAAQERLALDKEYHELTEQTLAQAHKAKRDDALSMVNIQRAVVENAEAMLAVVESEHQLREKKYLLLNTMGIPNASIDWKAMGFLPPKWKIPTDEAALLTLARDNRLDVAAALEKVNMIEAGLGLAKTKRLPDVSLNVAFQKNFNDREAILTGFSFSLPIFDNGDPAVAMEMAKLTQARMALLSLSEKAQREVLTSYNRLLEARSQMEIINKTQLEAALSAQNSSIHAYSKGLIDYNTVLMTQRSHVLTARHLIQLKFATMQAMCMLRQAIGGSFNAQLGAVPDIDIH